MNRDCNSELWICDNVDRAFIMCMLILFVFCSKDVSWTRWLYRVGAVYCSEIWPGNGEVAMNDLGRVFTMDTGLCLFV